MIFNKRVYTRCFLSVFFTILAIVGYSQAVAIPDKPNKETSFYDFGTQALSPNEQQAIEQKLVRYAAL